MNGNIVNLSDYRHQRLSYNVVNNNLISKNEEKIISYIILQENFNKDLKSIHYYTCRPCFKYPTTLCNFKKDINPVVALYHTLQEVLLTFNKNNTKHLWVIGLFDNKQWLSLLLLSLDADIAQLENLVSKYSYSHNSLHISNKIKELFVLIDKFKHYSSVFSSIEEWKENNKT